ncbi:serine hydrolase domain-containing protein [Allohahella marinimesophila]|uniref:EstA family serine hydrolase n=1 Tax=Allohahella marinimesophila TaxID=1054972 RepID=A0ABP7PCW7_9GAMM
MPSYTDPLQLYSSVSQGLARSSNGFLRRQLNLLEAPANAAGLANITDIDPNEVDPETLGISRDGVESIWEATTALYQSGTQPAVTLCIRKQGKLLMHRAIGHAALPESGDAESAATAGSRIRLDTPVCIFSASKAVTGALIHKLVEDGEISLSDPVSFYRPEFAERGKGDITIHQILSHRGGIPGLPAHEPVETLYDDERVWRLLCEAKPIAVDGGKLAYHAITGGFVLAKVLEKVTGNSIQNYLDTHLRKPLGMKYFQYGLAEEFRDKGAVNVAAGPSTPFPLSLVVKRALGASFKEAARISNGEPWHNAVVPAGNIYSTAEETSRFFQMLLQGGRWNGQQVLSERSVQRLTEEVGTCSIDRTMLIPMRYSAGLMLGADPVGLFGPFSKQAFGHIGLINKFCWADPQRNISVSLLTTGLSLVSHHLLPLGLILKRINSVCERNDQR